MDGLRVVLLILGVLLIAGLYVWDTRRRRRSRRAHPADHLDESFESLDWSRSGLDSEPVDLALDRLGEIDTGGEAPEHESPEVPREPVHSPPGQPETAGGGAAAGSEPAPKAEPPRRAPRAAAGDASSAGAMAEGEELIVALTVMAKGDARLTGPELAAALEAQGLRLGEMDVFHHHGVGERATASPVFSVANVLEPGTFDPEAMERFETPGVCLFLRLPGELDGTVALELMLDTGRRLVERLDAVLCDESRNVLTNQAVNHLREQVREFGRRQMLKTL